MSSHTGYLLIADISGYTQFLTSSEMDHANPILQSLLGVLIEQVGDPLHFWKTEGDAVLAYSTRQEFPSGESFLTICENLYNAFALRRQDIISNTTCPCNACANVSGLDLKVIAHHGDFDPCGGKSKISGETIDVPSPPSTRPTSPNGWSSTVGTCSRGSIRRTIRSPYRTATRC